MCPQRGREILKLGVPEASPLASRGRQQEIFCFYSVYLFPFPLLPLRQCSLSSGSTYSLLLHTRGLAGPHSLPSSSTLLYQQRAPATAGLATNFSSITAPGHCWPLCNSPCSATSSVIQSTHFWVHR